MTITIEEVKKLAIKCGFGISCNTLVCNITDLQAFYQRACEDGRKMQREMDAKLCERQKFMVLSPLRTRSAEENCSDMKALAKSLARAIRNNTGE